MELPELSAVITALFNPRFIGKPSQNRMTGVIIRQIMLGLGRFSRAPTLKILERSNSGVKTFSPRYGCKTGTSNHEGLRNCLFKHCISHRAGIYCLLTAHYTTSVAGKNFDKNNPDSKSSHMGTANKVCDRASGGVKNMATTKTPTMT